MPTQADQRPAPATRNRALDPIGVFDSGVGGLSVLGALCTELPNEAMVYVADNAHAPYGERDDTHIIARARAVAQYLLKHHHIKALVVACNTATAAAIELLRQEYPQLAIVGIEPALKPAAAQSTTGVIGVMATRATLNSEKFRRLAANLGGQARFVIQPCNGLADAIEREDAIQIEALCAEFTGAMGTFGQKPGEMDALVLGCTHYPFASDVIRRQVGDLVTFLEGGAPVARQTRRLLAELGWLAPTDYPTSIGAGTLKLHTTGPTAPLQTATSRWLAQNLPVERRSME